MFLIINNAKTPQSHHNSIKHFCFSETLKLQIFLGDDATRPLPYSVLPRPVTSSPSLIPENHNFAIP